MCATLNYREEEKSKKSSGMLEVLSENFKPQHNETVLSLSYCKLEREGKNC